jgi:MFS family permease
MTQSVRRSRPGGVTVLAVLQILSGIGALVLGAGSAMLMGMVGQYAPPEASAQAGILGALSGMMSIVFITAAVVSFLVAWGFLTGKSWARWLGIAFAALEAIYGILSLPGGVVTVAIGALIIYYLTRPASVEWFNPIKAATSTVT